MLRQTVVTGLVSAAVLTGAGAALSSAPPVGPLPAGPTRAIVTKPNATFVVTLPKSSKPGLVWRVARPYNGAVVRQLAEGERKDAVWVRYKALAAGKTSIVFALTRGETRHAFAARTFRITVR